MPIAGATSTTYVATMAGNYKCRVTKTATGCFKNSNAIAVAIVCKEGQYFDVDINIVPNPADSYINITLPVTDNLSYFVFDALGQIVLEGQHTGDLFVVDISTLPAGAYLIQCRSDMGIATGKFVKQ
jgi:hypothetical protein